MPDEKELEKKICKHCLLEKPVSEYNKAGGGKWLQPYCKSCDSERKKKWQLANKDKIKEKKRADYLNNRKLVDPELKKISRQKSIEALKIAAIKYRDSIPVLDVDEKKRRKREGDKRYREANIDKVMENKRKYQESGRATEMAKKWQKRKMNDLEFRLKKNMRSRVYVALKRGIKSQSTMGLLGCSIEYFKNYFESKFMEGMSWEVYLNGGIHIDHVIPCAKFDLTKPDEQKKCFHYTNLQPLWELDNLKKGVKIYE
jgi:hypothetical protein